MVFKVHMLCNVVAADFFNLHTRLAKFGLTRTITEKRGTNMNTYVRTGRSAHVQTAMNTCRQISVRTDVSACVQIQ